MTSKRPVMRGGALQKAIIDRARQCGWRVAHFTAMEDKRGTWRTPVAADGRGFPDLLLVRERVIAVEVKGDGDYLKPEQQDWIDSFLMAGVEAYVWTPPQWPDEISRILTKRGKPA